MPECPELNAPSVAAALPEVSDIQYKGVLWLIEVAPNMLNKERKRKSVCADRFCQYAGAKMCVR